MLEARALEEVRQESERGESRGVALKNESFSRKTLEAPSPEGEPSKSEAVFHTDDDIQVQETLFIPKSLLNIQKVQEEIRQELSEERASQGEKSVESKSSE